MYNRLLLAAALGFGSLLLAGCSQTPCDRASKFDLQTKAGDCQLSTRDTVLGPKAACDSALSACSDSERKVLDGIVDCFEALPVCSSADNLGWLTQSMGCYAPAQNLTEGCRQALFGDVIPGQDAGDAGVADAGFPPDETDAGALDLFVTADETQVALAWTQSQPGAVDHWDLIGATAADVREAPVQLPGSERFLTQDAGPGVKKFYYLLGLDSAGQVVYGEPDAGTPVPEDAGTPEPEDAGTPMCAGALDCPVDQVCNLGTCQPLACETPEVCPGGYLCGATSHVCERQYGLEDAGTPDAGTPDAGTPDAGTGQTASAPFVSERVEVATGTPSWSGDRVASAFAGTNPDIAAADTARQFVILDQESQVFGYWTEDRGGTWHAVAVDPIGQRPKVAYEPQSKTLFACYSAAGGIRVRRSLDFGKTWGTEAFDLANLSPDDGGQPAVISDCDIAAWQNGTAIVVGREGDAIKMWAVTRELNTVIGPDTIFNGTGAAYTNPSEIALATLPSESIIHVVFTAQVSGSADTDVIGIFRGSGATVFTGPRPLHKTPSSFIQGSPTVAIDPVTKRGIAAFVWKDGADPETVYVAMADAQGNWVTGPDLNVFTLNKEQSAYPVMPLRPVSDTETWVARAPSVAVTRNGRITIAFAAGAMDGLAPVLTHYSVGFDFETFSPLAINAKGWFSGPAAIQAPDATRVLRAGSREVAGPVLTVDPQISTYSVFIEGVGANGDTANRPVMISNPR